MRGMRKRIANSAANLLLTTGFAAAATIAAKTAIIPNATRRTIAQTAASVMITLPSYAAAAERAPAAQTSAPNAATFVMRAQRKVCAQNALPAQNVQQSALFAAMPAATAPPCAAPAAIARSAQLFAPIAASIA